jgi:hypothetical protein
MKRRKFVLTRGNLFYLANRSTIKQFTSSHNCSDLSPGALERGMRKGCIGSGLLAQGYVPGRTRHDSRGRRKSLSPRFEEMWRSENRLVLLKLRSKRRLLMSAQRGSWKGGRGRGGASFMKSLGRYLRCCFCA